MQLLLNKLFTLHVSGPGRALRSADDPTRLAEPRTRGEYGDRRFAVAGPSLWNDLPRVIREGEVSALFPEALKDFTLWAHM